MAAQLLRVEPGAGGIIRKVSGRGFSYVSAHGQRITSDALRDRIEALAIPPAWTQVWIASDAQSHIQATGVDAAGRTQYIYHPRWREMRDDEKFIHSQAFAQRLPAMRRAVTRDLKQLEDTKRRTLAAAVRLIDRAGLRVGGASYAEDNGSFGVTTLQRRHVHSEGEKIHLVFQGKSAGRWNVNLVDEVLGAYFASVPSTPRKGPALSYLLISGRDKQWHAVSDSEVNRYLGEVAGSGFTAKDFRTWQGTVVAAISLAKSYRKGTSSSTAVTAAIQDAAAWLHNTAAIAKDSYVNPRVIALFELGKVAQLNCQHDSAVLRLLEADGTKH
ncbi:DNA topoisomerase I [Arthrobacter psychrolactophilus]|uniref:DNA topoisomerase n=1 Tax=Arthrobacter psychrolactophilus TaxID=92442 RepID=A0A2V5IPZ9_9MICC|nr:DNA topoisomerase IB [Arthrobacter psychrolactophilus]PYI38649.1 DNA topoisomerase I [Arthrobacter psychrolactophilus]